MMKGCCFYYTITCDINGWLTTELKYLFLLCMQSSEKMFIFDLLNYIWKFACACSFLFLFFWMSVAQIWRSVDGVACERVNSVVHCFWMRLFPGQKGLSHAGGPLTTRIPPLLPSPPNVAATVPLCLGGPRVLFTMP